MINIKCKNCGVSMFDKPLHRTNPVGQPDAGWMCAGCISKKEPELFNNLQADNEIQIANDIMEAIKVETTNAWKIIVHRKPVPTVIQNRMGEVKQWIRCTKRIDKLKYELEKVFANTKVQVGEIQDEKNVTFLFIRNQGKGIAHILIKRARQ